MWDLLTSAAGGGILGLIGSGVKAWGAFKQKQLDMKHELDMTEQLNINMHTEMELAKLRGTIDLELQESVDDSANLRSALEAESAISNTSQWVNDLRGSVRPFLTYGLVILAAFKPLEDYIFMATTAVTFWFGDRPRKK